MMKVSNSALRESARLTSGDKQTMIVVAWALFFNLSFFKIKISGTFCNRFAVRQFDDFSAFPAENQTLDCFKMFRVQIS